MTTHMITSERSDPIDVAIEPTALLIVKEDSL